MVNIAEVKKSVLDRLSVPGDWNMRMDGKTYTVNQAIEAGISAVEKFNIEASIKNNAQNVSTILSTVCENSVDTKSNVYPYFALARAIIAFPNINRLGVSLASLETLLEITKIDNAFSALGISGNTCLNMYKADMCIEFGISTTHNDLDIGGGATYRELWNNLDKMKDAGKVGTFKPDGASLSYTEIFKRRVHFPKVLAAMRYLENINAFGDKVAKVVTNESAKSSTAESASNNAVTNNYDTKTDFSTNEETDWLLDPSDDERKYGINIYEGEQPLIKFSTAKAIDDSGDACEALKQYSEFLYYLLNSEVSTANVQCLSMPWIRPGFNVWYDPVYSDKVYYCTGVQHQGSPDAGARTNLTLILGRPSQVFVNDKDKFGSQKSESDNVFINDMIEKYRVKNFGPCVSTSDDFNSVKDAAKVYYGSETFETCSAESSAFHKNLYSEESSNAPAPDNIDKNKMFLKSYTKEEIENQLKSLYDSAPDVVKERRNRLKTIVSDANNYVEKYHVMQKNQG